MPKQTKFLAFVVYPGLRLLDLIGSQSILMSLIMGAGYRSVTVSEQSGAVTTDTPMQIVPQMSFIDLPDPDALVVVGGDGAAIDALNSPALCDYITHAARKADFIASIGTGSLILAALGLLNNRPATTHWAYADILEQLGARYVHKPWVDDGRFITAAGVSAGVDMALYLTGKLVGESRARMSQLFAEYDPEPPGGSIDWNAVPQTRRAALTVDQQAILDWISRFQPQPASLTAR